MALLCVAVWPAPLLATLPGVARGGLSLPYAGGVGSSIAIARENSGRAVSCPAGLTALAVWMGAAIVVPYLAFILLPGGPAAARRAAA